MKVLLLNPLCAAVITAGPAWMETTGIDVNVLQDSPAQTAESVSVDLWPLSHLICSLLSSHWSYYFFILFFNCLFEALLFCLTPPHGSSEQSFTSLTPHRNRFRSSVTSDFELFTLFQSVSQSIKWFRTWQVCSKPEVKNGWFQSGRVRLYTSLCSALC